MTCEWRIDGVPVDVGEWDVVVERNRINEATLEVGACDVPFESMCSFAELWCDDRLWHRFLTVSQARGRIELVGLMALLQRRLFPSGFVAQGSAVQIWNDLFTRANNVAPVFLTGNASGSAPSVTFNVEAKSMMADLASSLDPYVVWVEHAGALLARPVGAADVVALQGVFGSDCFGPGRTGSSRVNQVTVRWDEDLSGCAEYPKVQDGKLLQSPPLDFPEIRDPESADDMARKVFDELSVDQLVQDEVMFDAACFARDVYVPGRRFSTPVGVFGIESLNIEGNGCCVDEVSASLDQADVEALAARTEQR